jgi:hypothetical protein
MKKSFNIQEFLHHKSKRHETKLMHPSSSRAFQSDQERNLKHPSSMDLIVLNKTNKLPSFIDRYITFYYPYAYGIIFWETANTSISPPSQSDATSKYNKGYYYLKH